MSKVDEFNQEYNKNYNENECCMEYVLRDFINNAFIAIDYELSELQNHVDSGRYSNQDIYDLIQEIRERL